MVGLGFTIANFPVLYKWDRKKFDNNKPYIVSLINTCIIYSNVYWIYSVLLIVKASCEHKSALTTTNPSKLCKFIKQSVSVLQISKAQDNLVMHLCGCLSFHLKMGLLHLIYTLFSWGISFTVWHNMYTQHDLPIWKTVVDSWITLQLGGL